MLPLRDVSCLGIKMALDLIFMIVNGDEHLNAPTKQMQQIASRVNRRYILVIF
jgi:nitrate/nitrite-specific signal transduction histidine kinase